MMQTVYDKEGKPHTVEAVDAREYLRSGHYTSQCVEAAPAPVIEEAKPAAIASGPVELISGTAVPEADIPARPRGKPGPKPKVKPEVV